jgi:hypothetical protein
VQVFIFPLYGHYEQIEGNSQQNKYDDNASSLSHLKSKSNVEFKATDTAKVSTVLHERRSDLVWL